VSGRDSAAARKAVEGGKGHDRTDDHSPRCDAVRSYEQQGYLGPAISRPLDGRIILMVSGEARKATENLKAQIAAAQQPKRKIGF